MQNNMNLWVVVHKDLWDIMPKQEPTIDGDWVYIVQTFADSINYSGKVWDIVYGTRGLALLDEQLMALIGRKSYFTTPTPMGSFNPTPKQEKTVTQVGKYGVKK